MTHLHFCLTKHPGQLIRWQKAFPYGRIVSRPEDILPYAKEQIIIWLHTDLMEPGTLAQTLDWLKQNCPHARIVALSGIPDPSKTMHLLKQGVRGCCHVLSAPEMFQRIAKVTSNGGYWLGEDLLTHMIQAIPHPEGNHSASRKQDALSCLSHREMTVAELVGQGASNREIAETLGISEKTVKAHLSSIFQKLSLRDRLQLALLVRNTPH